MDEAKNQINDLENKEAKTTIRTRKRRIQENKDSVSSLWDNFKHSKICMLGLLEEEKEQ